MDECSSSIGYLLHKQAPVAAALGESSYVAADQKPCFLNVCHLTPLRGMKMASFWRTACWW